MRTSKQGLLRILKSIHKNSLEGGSNFVRLYFTSGLRRRSLVIAGYFKSLQEVMI